MSRNQIIALVGCGGLLLIVLFWGGCALVVASIASRGQETSTPTAEETIEEVTEETTAARQRVKRYAADETTKEETRREASNGLPPKPPISDPEGRIRYNISGGLGTEHFDEEVIVQADANNCYHIQVNYSTPFEGSGIRGMPPVYYRATYGDDELRNRICSVQTNAYGELTDKYGQKSKELFLSTSMGAEEARRINWNNSYSVDFAKIYTVDYLHPTVRGNIEKEIAEQALDCAHDSGLFDFDWLTCP